MAETDAPRVRFAPSPTGYLHIGGVRTALFNWLWARQKGGTFVLRIEDTDRERSTAENKELILREMRWLGLDWDEGPEVGGEHGPYNQMDRLAIYKRHVDQLIEQGAAYRCYATKEELAKAREDLKADDPKAQFRYPGWWREKTTADWPADKPYVVRLKTPNEGETGYHDLVFGDQKVPNSSLQDVVLMRSDGVPLYNLGCVIDDITMGITLVARGRDHMINTPLQVLIYRALGKEPPQFAHLPLMLAKGGAKLSKRHGTVSVGEYRDQGYAPAALLNYLARFGWSFGDQEIFSVSELIEKFDWARCNRSDGRFDPDKLLATNFEHLKEPKRLSEDEYVYRAESFLDDRFGSVDDTKLRSVLPQIRPRAKTFLDAAERLDWLFADSISYDEKGKKKFLLSDRNKHLAQLRTLLAEAESFSALTLEERVKTWAEEDDIKLGAIAQPARVALTGSTVSPGIFDVMELLGREVSLARLDAAIALGAAGLG
jgi:glutamyl-tRNA synthetase